jgi:hypothetical protein
MPPGTPYTWLPIRYPGMARAKNPKMKRDVKNIWLPRKHSRSPMMRTMIQSFVSKYNLK